MSYQYDVFLSYRRSGHGGAGEWVRNHFHPLLRTCLTDEVEWDPTIFIDLEAETGVHWPDMLARKLLASKLLVAVWSPPYFRSSWCLAEWETMQARERMISPDRPDGLVYPVVFSDSKTFPEAARNREARDLKPWAIPFPAFGTSHKYLDFHDEMRKIAAELGERLRKVPPWQPNWPVRRPEEFPPPEPNLADL